MSDAEQYAAYCAEQDAYEMDKIESELRDRIEELEAEVERLRRVVGAVAELPDTWRSGGSTAITGAPGLNMLVSSAMDKAGQCCADHLEAVLAQERGEHDAI